MLELIDVLLSSSINSDINAPVRSMRVPVATSPEDTLTLASVELRLSRLAFSMWSSGSCRLWGPPGVSGGVSMRRAWSSEPVESLCFWSCW